MRKPWHIFPNLIYICGVIEDEEIMVNNCKKCHMLGKDNCPIHFQLQNAENEINCLVALFEEEYHGHFRKKYYMSEEMSEATINHNKSELFSEITEDHDYMPFEKLPRDQRKCSIKERRRYFGNTCEKTNQNLIEFFDNLSIEKPSAILKFLKEAVHKKNSTVVAESKILGKILKCLCDLDLPPKYVVAKDSSDVSYLVLPFTSLSFISIESFLKENPIDFTHEFPHVCNTKKYFGYSGPIEFDFFCSSFDDDITVKRKKMYYDEYFENQEWDFFIEVEKHLNYQMKVLIEKGKIIHSVANEIQDLIIKFWTQSWKAVSPISYMTWNQFGFHLCGCLCLDKNDVRICKQFFQYPYVANCSDFEYLYTMFEAFKYDDEDLFGGFLTKGIKYFNKYAIDCYSEKRKKITELLECRSHLHHPCRTYRDLHKKKSFGLTYDERKERRRLRKKYIKENFEEEVKEYEEEWQCEFFHKIIHDPKFKEFKKQFKGLNSQKTKKGKLKKPLKRLRMASCISGAKNEIFQMYFSKDKFPDYDCLYLDYFSHYGSIMLEKFPCGNYVKICQDKIKNHVEFDEESKILKDKSTNDIAVGLVKCTLKSPQNKIDGNMPYIYKKFSSKQGSKDVSAGVLCTECYESNNTNACTHSQTIQCSINISDLHHCLNVRNYTLVAIHEVILWKDQKFIFKRLMEILLYLKVSDKRFTLDGFF